MRIFWQILPFVFISQVCWVWAQGCSDSGFCTMGAIRPAQVFIKDTRFKLRSIELNYHYGRTRFKDNIWVTNLEGNFSVGKTLLQLRVPYIKISGALGSLSGIGDISLSLSRAIINTEKNKIAILLGARLPANDGNRLSPDHNLPLPSYYQTSLGTFDAILGLSWMNKDWLIATGLQQPLSQNKNNFLWGLWERTALEQTVQNYPISQEIKRAPDVMLRIERKLRIQKWTIHAGLLGIYRLNRDRIRLPENGQITEVNGSQGLASNAVLGLAYSLNVHHHLKLIIGKKINERQVTLDGLQREYIAQINYEWRF